MILFLLFFVFVFYVYALLYGLMMIECLEFLWGVWLMVNKPPKLG